jgi:hypothetical protein
VSGGTPEGTAGQVGARARRRAAAGAADQAGRDGFGMIVQGREGADPTQGYPSRTRGATGAARWIRVEAARSERSVSQFLALLVEERRERAEGYESARERFMSREPRPLRDRAVPLPARAKLHDRGPRVRPRE